MLILCLICAGFVMVLCSVCADSVFSLCWVCDGSKFSLCQVYGGPGFNLVFLDPVWFKSVLNLYLFFGLFVYNLYFIFAEIVSSIVETHL